jgi:hypothetical protein
MIRHQEKITALQLDSELCGNYDTKGSEEKKFSSAGNADDAMFVFYSKAGADKFMDVPTKQAISLSRSFGYALSRKLETKIYIQQLIFNGCLMITRWLTKLLVLESKVIFNKNSKSHSFNRTEISP